VADFANTWSTNTQIQTYLASARGVDDPNAIYTIWNGINDLKLSTAAIGGNPGNIVLPPNFIAINTLANHAVGEVQALASAGARYILVPNISLLSNAALAASGNPTNDPTANDARAQYDQAVWNGLAAKGINFIPADAAAITSAVQQIISDYFYALIVAPSEISFLAEAPVKTRTAVIDSITSQIPLSFGTPGTFHGWVSGDVSWLKIDSSYAGFPNDPGTPASTTAGFDYALTRDWLIGAAFSGGTMTQTFSLGGDFSRPNTRSASTAPTARMHFG